MTVALGFATTAGAGASSSDMTGDDIIAGINWYKTQNGGIPPASWSWWGAMNTPTGDWSTGNSIPGLAVLERMRDYPGGAVTPMLNIMYWGPSFLRLDRAMTYSSATSASGIEDGQIRFNSASPASVTEIYISEKSAEYRNTASAGSPAVWVRKDFIFTHVQAGDKIVVSASPLIEATAALNKDRSNSRSFFLTVSAVQDMGSYRKVTVTGAGTAVNRPTSMFTNGNRVWVGMAQSTVVNDVWSYDKIAPVVTSNAGTFDDYFTALGDRIEDAGFTVLIRPFLEPNEDFFATWPGQPTPRSEHLVWNGSAYSTVKGYANYNMNNDVAGFKRLFKRFHDKVRARTTHAKFIYCGMAGGQAKINNSKNMFPGNDACEYYGIDVYNDKIITKLLPFSGQAKPFVAMFKSLGSKKIIIPEFGVPGYVLTTSTKSTSVYDDGNSLSAEYRDDRDDNDVNIDIVTDRVVLDAIDMETAAVAPSVSLRRNWLDDAFRYMKSEPRIVGASYFNLDFTPQKGDFRLEAKPACWAKWKSYSKQADFRGDYS